MSVVLQKNCEYFLLEICKPLRRKASEAKISELKPPDRPSPSVEGFLLSVIAGIKQVPIIVSNIFGPAISQYRSLISCQLHQFGFFQPAFKELVKFDKGFAKYKPENQRNRDVNQQMQQIQDIIACINTGNSAA